MAISTEIVKLSGFFMAYISILLECNMNILTMLQGYSHQYMCILISLLQIIYLCYISWDEIDWEVEG
jgi:hypothetical protein